MPVCVERNRSTAFGEERLDDSGAVGGQDAPVDFHLMVEARVGEDLEAGADGAAFGVVRSVDEAGDAGLDDGTGAHAAGLDGDVEGGIRKAVIAEEAGGFAKNDDFGVGGGVAIADGAVAGTDENLAVMDEDSAYGDFVGSGCCAGLAERFLHELDIGFHAGERIARAVREDRNPSLRQVAAAIRILGISAIERRSHLLLSSDDHNYCLSSIGRIAYKAYRAELAEPQ
jgi:hypothetical protein